MVFKIGICDDDLNILTDLKKYIECYSIAYDVDFDIYTFSSGSELLQAHTKFFFDIIMLDIEIKTENGIELAKSIRKIIPPYQHSTYIIFITSYPQYMHNAFDVQAFQYINKPTNYSKIESLISATIKHFSDSSRAKILLNTIEEQHYVPLNEIVCIHYLKTQKTFAEYILTTQTIIAKANMKQLENCFYNYGLISPCKGYLINIQHIKTIRNDVLLMDNQLTIDISRRKKTYVQKVFANYILSN